MEEPKRYRYGVRLAPHPEIEVIAPDRYWATREAAKRLGVRWRETARDMVVQRISRKPVKEKRRKAEGHEEQRT